MTEPAAAPASLDHVGLVGRDLADWIARYRRLGFEPTEPRPLLGHDAASGVARPIGQSSAHLVFASGYVELTAIDGDPPGHHLASYLQRGAGLHILAFGTRDLPAAHARCVAAGVPVRPVAVASRRIEYGSQRGEARFEWFMLEPEAAPEGLVCCVRHVTPELVFQPEVQWHPNGALGLAGVYVVARQAASVVRRLAAITGARCGPGGELRLAGGWVRVLEPAAFAQRFAGAHVPPPPCLAGFAVKVRDGLRAAGLLAGHGVDAVRGSDGRRWVGASEAGGCVLEFLE